MAQAPPMPELAVAFFSKFARLEFALKSVPKYRRIRNNVVEACWEVFSSQPHVRDLYEGLCKNPEASYLIDHPPKKRVVINNRLDWDDPPSRCQDMAAVCLMLRRTRNNLFHGDKGSVGSERDTSLLKSGAMILDALIDADHNVALEYNFQY